MFRKGIVTFFDDRLGLGHIELVADHRQIIFKLENFSNTSLLPQIGERVKCIVVEEHGEFLAKFIVRLDHKNYVADKKKPLSSHYAYDENSFENVRNSRKILKKRRISADNIAHENEHSPDSILSDHQNHISEKDENQSTEQRNAFATQSTKTVQFQQVAIQPQIIKSSSYTEPFVEAIKPIQIKEAQPVIDEVAVVDTQQPIVDEQISEPIETVQALETTESIQSIQVKEVQPVVDEVIVIDTQQPIVDEQISEPIETVQVLETTESIQQIQVEEVQPVVDEVVVIDTQQPIVEEQIFESIETVQMLETTESIQQIQVKEVQPVVDEVVVVDTQQPIVDEQIFEPIETVQALETTESTQQIQVEEVKPVVDDVVNVDTQQPIVEEQIFEPIETVQALETTEAVQSIQAEEVQPVVDDVVNVDTQQSIVEEQILEPVQKVEIVEPLKSNLSIEKATESIPVVIQAIETAPVADAFPPVKDKAEPNANTVDRQKQLLERQLLEKNMNLTASQKFIQKMKVKFLYSKRKQTQAKPEVKKQFNFNPWILVTGVVLLGVINLGFYARDQYTEYKTESLLKLQQYENAQKEEIKRQKKEATAR